MPVTLQNAAIATQRTTAENVPAAPRRAAPSTPTPAPVPAAEPPQRKPADKEVQRALAQVKRAVEAIAPSKLDFSIDRETGQSVIRVIDQNTGEVIRQIPAQELIEIAKSIDRMRGLLLKQQA